jgi:enoyl-CoA hydratase
VAVTQETRGRTLIVRIDREAKRNAINAETADGIDAALNRLDDDPALAPSAPPSRPWTPS